ncbi:MAG TPA: methyltransferase domain-containing protein [Anaerohalosphaeraceae bacterium]|jgi:SAM-dependent methyltransferase|nr:methyltransferase domain-containing protein [Anaerohalosphaeraceae bacterium]HRT49990.1 methyltransferase domain-containing protein [Anaerohalosphaeraceae bacterium]HRT85712.1 methyltransferase domain-containing protein [Anaerohalosphaeraceae bacterium]
MGIIRRCLPRPLWDAAFAVQRLARRIAHIGLARYCPVCRACVRRFEPYGVSARQDARCPVCGALERMRFVWLVLDARPEMLAPGSKILHIAPEDTLAARFRRIPGVEYVSADLDAARAMVRMDVQQIQYPDNTFSFIYCSHVLEHVPDDRQAMREFHRVLKPGGTALIMVPITADQTWEDPSVTDPAERLRLFGQHDHVRRYGPDVLDRLRGAGFDVETIHAPDVAEEKDLVRMALGDSHLYLCRKP